LYYYLLLVLVSSLKENFIVLTLPETKMIVPADVFSNEIFFFSNNSAFFIPLYVFI
jgi:hypothetical protein